MAQVNRYINNLPAKTLQQLHNICVWHNSIVNPLTGMEPLSVKQVFFIHDLMKTKKNEGQVIECEDIDCSYCSNRAAASA